MTVLRSPLTDDFIKFLAILNTRSICCETPITCQFGLSNSRGQCSKLSLILNRKSAPLVISTAWVDIMWRKEAMIIAVTLLDFAIDGIFNDSGISERDCRESLTKVDPLSLACAPGMTKRGNNHKRRTYTSSRVGVARPNTRRLSIRPAGQVHDTCL